MSLTAHKLGVAFGSDWVFRSVSFVLQPGQRVALVGPSGSGKSLLLKSLALLHPLTEGHINWAGQSVTGASVPLFRAQVMYVPQRTSNADGSVVEFLSLPFSFKAHASKRFDRDRASRLLNLLGRGNNFLEKSQRDLSGGEMQIAALVRAMLLDPQFLLLDEPTSAMDGNTASAAEKLVSDWCRDDSQRSTLWVTHDLQQAERVSEKVVQIEKGKDHSILGIG